MLKDTLARGAQAVTRFVKARPAVALVIGIGLLFLLWQFGGGIVARMRLAVTVSSTRSTETQARTEEKAAQGEKGTASEEKIERRVEDGVRERVIQPEIERTRRAAAESRQRTEKAVRNYEATQTGVSRESLDDGALRERNCADLRALYPEQRFKRCAE